MSSAVVPASRPSLAELYRISRVICLMVFKLLRATETDQTPKPEV